MAAAERCPPPDPSQMRGFPDLPPFCGNRHGAASPQDARPSPEDVPHPGVERASRMRQERQQLADDRAEQPPPIQEDDVRGSDLTKSRQLQENQDGGRGEDKGR